MREDTMALLTVAALGKSTKAQSKKIAMWLRKTADSIENESSKYTSTGKATFRLMKVNK